MVYAVEIPPTVLLQTLISFGHSLSSSCLHQLHLSFSAAPAMVWRQQTTEREALERQD